MKSPDKIKKTALSFGEFVKLNQGNNHFLRQIVRLLDENNPGSITNERERLLKSIEEIIKNSPDYSWGMDARQFIEKYDQENKNRNRCIFETDPQKLVEREEQKKRELDRQNKINSGEEMLKKKYT